MIRGINLRFRWARNPMRRREEMRWTASAGIFCLPLLRR